jgi:hypothetical protein
MPPVRAAQERNTKNVVVRLPEKYLYHILSINPLYSCRGFFYAFLFNITRRNFLTLPELFYRVCCLALYFEWINYVQ